MCHATRVTATGTAIVIARSPILYMIYYYMSMTDYALCL